MFTSTLCHTGVLSHRQAFTRQGLSAAPAKLPTYSCALLAAAAKMKTFETVLLAFSGEIASQGGLITQRRPRETEACCFLRISSTWSQSSKHQQGGPGC